MEPAATKRPPTVNKASKYETNYLGSRDNEYHDIWQKNARDTQVKPNCLCSSINKKKKTSSPFKSTPRWKTILNITS